MILPISASRLRLPTLACTVAVSLLLAACGGGGGEPGSGIDSNSPNFLAPSVTSAGVGRDLKISEVASNYYNDDIAWFEVHNPGGSPVSLANYTLRSSNMDLGSRTISYAPIDFPMPDTVVPAGGYVVVAAKVLDSLKPNRQMVYVRHGNAVPFWTAHGSIELVRGESTVDFVRFGNASATPASSFAWRSANVQALPSGPQEHGKSIVRLQSANMPDSDTRADWALVNFATPAGPNDVDPGIIDSDLDGIPDSAKRPGGTYAGMDLYVLGARPGRRDIFVEIDFMKGNDPALQPRREALQKVADAFAARGIGLHLDTGPLYGERIDPANFNLGGGNEVGFSPCIELATAGGARAGCTSFYDYKSAHFDVRRNLVFHYALFANSLRIDGAAGASGVAELNGNDLIISLGGYDLVTAPEASFNLLVNLQAGTLMHELGHNLGLRHGGHEDANYKPNHYSVMNYMYQFAGLSAAPNSVHAAERYYLANNLKNKTLCNLVENSPCSTDFRIDYSDGTGAPLDENNLSEAFLIGRGAAPGAYADWDNNGVLTGGALARNLNPQLGAALTILRDYNEWGNLAIPFARGRAGNNYGDAMWSIGENEAERANPMNQRARHRIVEDALPPELQRIVRKAHQHQHAWRGHE